MRHNGEESVKHNRCSEKFITLLVVMTVLLIPSRLFAEEPSYSTSLGFEFTTGKYGTGIKTDAIFMPFTVAVYPTERLDFSLQIPYVYQSSSAVVAGEFRGMQQQSMGMGSQSVLAAMGSMGSGTGGPGPRTTASAANVDKSQNGLGDITFRAGYIVVPEGDYLPGIRPNFFVKFPTADKNKFLGTGAFDGGLAVELTKWFGYWLTIGELGYAVQGKSSVLAVKNYLYYNAGAGYQIGERLRPMLMLKGSTPPVEGASSQLEARLRVKYQITEHTGIDGYVSKGINTSSPDYGTGLAVCLDF